MRKADLTGGWGLLAMGTGSSTQVKKPSSASQRQRRHSAQPHFRRKSQQPQDKLHSLSEELRPKTPKDDASSTGGYNYMSVNLANIKHFIAKPKGNSDDIYKNYAQRRRRRVSINPSCDMITEFEDQAEGGTNGTTSQSQQSSTPRSGKASSMMSKFNVYHDYIIKLKLDPVLSIVTDSIHEIVIPCIELLVWMFG